LVVEKPILVLLLAFFLVWDLLMLATRASLLNTNLARLLAQRESHEEAIGRAVALIHAPHALRATLNLMLVWLRVGMAGGALALYAPPDWKVQSLLICAGLLSLLALLLFLLEWLVEAAALRNPEAWALRLAPLARIFIILLTPLTVLPLAFSHNRTAPPEPAVTEDDLKSIVAAGEEDGVLEEDEREMIYSIFQLGDTLAREIMIPRIDMRALEVNTPLAEAVETLVQAGFSRLPVYEESVDQILGVLYARDLLQVWRKDQPEKPLRELLRPVYFVPEAKPVDELMAEMQAGRIHMAIVVDEYGGVAGLVTLEDIVEEIVGEIQDEYDQTEELPYQMVREGEYIVQGRVDLGEFNELLGSKLPQDEADTLGGFIYGRLGRAPTSGETLRVDGLLLTVELVSGRRIRKVRAHLEPQETPINEEGKQTNAE
jgi:CBS domain containing-hemolysin-like protein